MKSLSSQPSGAQQQPRPFLEPAIHKPVYGRHKFLSFASQPGPQKKKQLVLNEEYVLVANQKAREGKMTEKSQVPPEGEARVSGRKVCPFAGQAFDATAEVAGQPRFPSFASCAQQTFEDTIWEERLSNQALQVEVERIRQRQSRGFFMAELVGRYACPPSEPAGACQAFSSASVSVPHAGWSQAFCTHAPAAQLSWRRAGSIPPGTSSEGYTSWGSSCSSCCGGPDRSKSVWTSLDLSSPLPFSAWGVNLLSDGSLEESGTLEIRAMMEQQQAARVGRLAPSQPTKDLLVPWNSWQPFEPASQGSNCNAQQHCEGSLRARKRVLSTDRRITWKQKQQQLLLQACPPPGQSPASDTAVAEHRLNKVGGFRTWRMMAKNNGANHQRTVSVKTKGNLEQTKLSNHDSRLPSVDDDDDDASSELQRVASLEEADHPKKGALSSPNQAREKKQWPVCFLEAFCATSSTPNQPTSLPPPARIARLVMAVRGWTKKGMKEEERTDSFLERFRGPDVKALASESATAGGDGLAGQGQKK
ncbi:Cyclic nucleotide-gated olfactory channel, partial [Ophiophagus hannah]